LYVSCLSAVFVFVTLVFADMILLVLRLVLEMPVGLRLAQAVTVLQGLGRLGPPGPRPG
jgi:hypothetical protein